VKDLPSQTKLKFRKKGQSHPSEVRALDLKRKLEERERKYIESKGISEKNSASTVGDAIEDGSIRKRKQKLLRDEPEGEAAAAVKRHRPEDMAAAEDFNDSDDTASSDSDDGSDSASDSDDEEALLLELELQKIKKERAEQKRKEAAEVAAREHESVVRGNPLIGSSSGSSVARRWDDDVVFKNQAREEPQLKKRFVNDTIRNDFHRRFLKRYIQ